jgi:hypothetical protein
MRCAGRSLDTDACRRSGTVSDTFYTHRVDAPRMVFLGFGKFARSDRIYAVEPLPPEERGSGARTRVWVDGIPQPLIASRSERAILAEMGVMPARSRPAPQDENLF